MVRKRPGEDDRVYLVARAREDRVETDFTMGGAEWLGTELIVAGQGTAWLDPFESMTMLYGRNGAGKSTILEAIRALLLGQHVEELDARAYFRLVSLDVFDFERMLLWMVKGTRRTMNVSRTEWWWQARQANQSPLRLRGLFEEATRTLPVSDDELAGIRENFVKALTSISEQFPGKIEDVEGMAAYLADEWSTEVDRAPFGRPFWFIGAVLENAEQELFRTKGSWSVIELTRQLFGFDLEEFGVDRASWESRTWNPYSGEDAWVTMAAVWAVDALRYLGYVLDQVDGDDPDERTFREIADPAFGGRVGQALRAVCRLGVVSVRASGTPAAPGWMLRPAMDLEPSGLQAFMLDCNEKDAPWLARSLCAALLGGDGEDPGSHEALGLWGANDEGLRAALDPTRRYMSLPVGSDIPLKMFPIDLIDFDDDFDIDGALGEALAAKLNVDQDGVLMFSSDEVEVDLAPIELARQHVDAAGQMVIRLGLGIKALRLTTRMEIGSWILGRPMAVEAQDVATNRWVPVDSLSEAQRTWVRRVLQLRAASSLRKPQLVLTDEPEAGIHERAVVAAFEFLDQLDGLVVVATHHPRALTNPRATLLHVERGAAGDIQVRTPMLGGDVGEVAERFGVMPADLLGVKRLMIVVEGSHDRVVIEKLLARSSRRGVSERCLIAEARGVRNVATVADSVLLCNFTDMHVFVMVDNARAVELDLLIDGTRTAINQGVKPATAADRPEVRVFRDSATNEERWLLDLIDRATRQGLLDRIHIGGISTRDVIDLLPASAFGLTESWSALRRQHDDYRDALRKKDRGTAERNRPVDFKKWLQETKGARINIKTIAAAFDSQQTLHTDLLTLLQEIEILIDVAAL
jgi:energy-coupling factor transporter ATP-binding protein EcfA2